jgi:1-acyl-sn-glycerol-3-phosphate acyltransferase
MEEIRKAEDVGFDGAGPGRWYGFIHWLCQRVYYSRVRVRHAERFVDRDDVPVLYLSLHRNGAMDGFVHHALFPKMTFLIASKLCRHFFLRQFFAGIEIVRKQDSPGAESIRAAKNDEALDRCQAHLRANGQLLVFPEGTSDLGPRHLPFQSGASRILLRFLEENPGREIAVVPLGLHYERAWAFRSRVEVLVGNLVSTELDSEASSRARLGTLRRRISEALEEVGANFSSEELQEQGEAAAYASTLGTGQSYAGTLKRFDRHFPGSLGDQWKALQQSGKWSSLWLHQGLPLFPLSRFLTPLYALWFAVAAPVVLLGGLLNAPPLLASFLAGKFCADERNVISLWRVLIGIPAALIWFLFVVSLTVMLGQWGVFFAYLAASGLGFLSYYRVKKLAVTIHNGLRFPECRDDALLFHRSVLASLSYENTTI